MSVALSRFARRAELSESGDRGGDFSFLRADANGAEVGFAAAGGGGGTFCCFFGEGSCFLGGRSGEDTGELLADEALLYEREREVRES